MGRRWSSKTNDVFYESVFDKSDIFFSVFKNKSHWNVPCLPPAGSRIWMASVLPLEAADIDFRCSVTEKTDFFNQRPLFETSNGPLWGFIRLLLQRGLHKRTPFHIRKREHPLFFPTPGGPLSCSQTDGVSQPSLHASLPSQTGSHYRGSHPITDGHLTHRWQLQMNQG